MNTFVIGLLLLIFGGGLYGHLCNKVFAPDDRKTPAFTRKDGVDFVPMPREKNALINLLNIAGTGPILGPIQGILFGPIAFLTIPIGCIIGGAVHDYFVGMISVRENGIQMPEMIRQNTNAFIHRLYTVFVCLVLFLIGVVFVYTPGDIAATQLFGFGGTRDEASTWVIYSIIFIYYLIATLFPIDKLIGKIYPVFGGILLLSAVGLFIMLFVKKFPLLDVFVSEETLNKLTNGTGGSQYSILIYVLGIAVVMFIYRRMPRLLRMKKGIGKLYFIFGVVVLAAAMSILAILFINKYQLLNLWDTWELNGFDFGAYFQSHNFIPDFFVTVACGILSGFHATQITMVSRTIESEKDGRLCFYNMMLAEGFIAMVWAAATMAMIGIGAEASGITMKLTEGGYAYFAYVGNTLKQISPTSVVGVVCRDMLGPVGGMIAVVGVIILPVTSGDTALRSLRLILADLLHIRQDKPRNRILLSLPVFAVAYAVLIWAKGDQNGFNTIWRYFGWSNQSLAVFALASVTIWLIQHDRRRFFWIPLIPLIFYAFITCSYIMSAGIGFSLPYNISICIGAVFAAVVSALVLYKGYRGRRDSGDQRE